MKIEKYIRRHPDVEFKFTFSDGGYGHLLSGDRFKWRCVFSSPIKDAHTAGYFAESWEELVQLVTSEKS